MKEIRMSDSEWKRAANDLGDAVEIVINSRLDSGMPDMNGVVSNALHDICLTSEEHAAAMATMERKRYPAFVTFTPGNGKDIPGTISVSIQQH